MGVYSITEESLTGLADAIRRKAKLSEKMNPEEMILAVNGIITQSHTDIDGMIMRTSEVIESTSASYVASYAFYKNPSVRVVVLPNAYEVGEYAFSQCPNLEHVSTGARKIEGYAFFYCDELIEVLFDKDLVSIGSAAFSGCSSLATVNLRKTTTRTLGASAFSNSGVSELYLPENTFCSLSSSSVFSGTAIGEGGAGGTIYVPMKYRVSYESNAAWASVFRNDKNRVVTY